MDLRERFRHFLEALQDVGWNGVVDMVIVTAAVYALLIALKRTRRSGLVFTGVVIVSAVYLLALQLELALTVALLQGFFAVILVALIVIFQEDLRYVFERVGLWWSQRPLPHHRRRPSVLPRREVEVLARTLGDLARARVGALIVIRGRDAIARHLVGGEEVDGRLSEPLLKSIFDPHSPGHDGAVIIDGHLIDRLGSHLPLSENLDQLPQSGTRHAAGLGLSERTDALCIVVSEERGSISVARRGRLDRVPTPAALLEVIEAFYEEVSPRPGARPLRDFFRRDYREKLVAVTVSVALWIVAVQRQQPVRRSFTVPVNFSLVPATLSVARVLPDEVAITFSGLRKAFGLSAGNRQDLKLVLDLSGMQLGRNTLLIQAGDLVYPREWNLEDVEPRHLIIDAVRKTPDGIAQPP